WALELPEPRPRTRYHSTKAEFSYHAATFRERLWLERLLPGTGRTRNRKSALEEESPAYPWVQEAASQSPPEPLERPGPFWRLPKAHYWHPALQSAQSSLLPSVCRRWAGRSC